MKLLNINQINSVSGGADSISPECFEAVNLYSEWWYYGLITPETFTSTYINYCTPDNFLIIDSTQLDIITCIPDEKVTTVRLVCG